MNAHAGQNPFGECQSGHGMFRGGCPDCMADMVREADITGLSAADETHIITDERKL